MIFIIIVEWTYGILWNVFPTIYMLWKENISIREFLSFWSRELLRLLYQHWYGLVYILKKSSNKRKWINVGRKKETIRSVLWIYISHHFPFVCIQDFSNMFPFVSFFVHAIALDSKQFCSANLLDCLSLRILYVHNEYIFDTES